jgi:hypothetical protein
MTGINLGLFGVLLGLVMVYRKNKTALKKVENSLDKIKDHRPDVVVKTSRTRVFSTGSKKYESIFLIVGIQNHMQTLESLLQAQRKSRWQFQLK